MNFGEMQQQVLDRVGGQAASESDLVRKIRAFLNASYRSLAMMRPWDWLIIQSSAAVTATTVDIAIPAACRNIFHVELRSIGTVLPFRNVSSEQIAAGALDYIGRGIPAAWTTLGRVMWTLPFPAGADTLDLLAYGIVTDMVADTDEPLLPTNHRQYLVEDTMAKFAAADSFDPTIAKMAWVQRNEALRSIMHTSATATPQVLPYQMLRRSIFGGGTHQ